MDLIRKKREILMLLLVNKKYPKMAEEKNTYIYLPFTKQPVHSPLFNKKKDT